MAFDISSPALSIALAAGKALIFLLIAIVCGAGVFITKWYVPYTKTIWEVREETQGGIRIWRDKAKRQIKNGITTYKLWAAKVELPPPSDSRFVMSEGGKMRFTVAKHLNGQWEYISYDPNKAKDTEMNTISSRWAEQLIREKRGKYIEEGWWAKNQVWAIPALGFMICLIAFIVTMSYATDIIKTASGQATGATQAVAQAMDRFTMQFGTAGSIPLGTGVPIPAAVPAPVGMPIVGGGPP